MRIVIQTNFSARATKWHVSRVLKSVSPQDIEGLNSIRVINDCPDDSEYVKASPYLRGFLYNGHYLIKTKSHPAEIVLYAGDVYFGIPKLLRWSPMATLKIARTLAHEVGHHVIATRGYIYNPQEKHRPWNGTRNPYEEDLADAYASDVIGRMIRHWPYKFGRWMATRLSNLLYEAGLQNYWDGNYQSAASLLARAHSLNLANEEAGQSFRHAMEKLRTNVPQSLNTADREWLAQRYSPSHPTAPTSTNLKNHSSRDPGKRKRSRLRKRSSAR